jgi:hypothetical protein
MSGTTDAILTHLKGKSPAEIEKTLRNLERMSTAQAEEAGAIAAKQAAMVEAMSLAEAQIKLERAIEKNDLAEIAKWAPVHRKKLDWVTDQMAANEQARVAEINKPAIEQRQAAHTAAINELDALNRKIGKNDSDWLRMRKLSTEIRELA